MIAGSPSALRTVRVGLGEPLLFPAPQPRVFKRSSLYRPKWGEKYSGADLRRIRARTHNWKGEPQR